MEIQPNILATRDILCLLIGLPINQELEHTIIVNSSILIVSLFMKMIVLQKLILLYHHICLSISLEIFRNTIHQVLKALP